MQLGDKNMELIKDLNDKQIEAVINIENPLLILAGAGSGKTRVITYKIAYLISNGFNPYNILALTFTNKAANEMKQRAIDFFPQAQNTWISTFHSLCVRILRSEIERLGYSKNFTILDSKDSAALIKMCIKELDLDEKIFVVKNVASQISFNKNKLIMPDEFYRQCTDDFRLKKIADIYNLYQEKLKYDNLLDFDDIIGLTVELFKNCPDVLEQYQNRFKYILIDEYQDTNAAQYLLIKLLVGQSKNICVVGDDDQSIYSWRGADINNILDFEKDFPDAKIIKLEQNYRSTQIILDAANAVIKNNSSRKDKNLWTSQKDGPKIFFYHAYSYTDEAKFLVDTINKNINEYGYGGCAVLYRNNFQSRIIEDEFVKRNIPYKLVGATRFYERMEIKDLLAYLKFINNPDDDTSFSRIISAPRKGIGAKTLDKIYLLAAENKCSYWKIVSDENLVLGYNLKSVKLFTDMMNELINYSQSNSIHQLLEKVIADVNYTDYLKKFNEYFGRLDNIEEFMAKIIEFESCNEDCSLTNFLEQISLLSEADNYTDEENCVKLMTLHGAKGLEFDCVFIFGADEELFPGHLKSGIELEEERRLFYVGITRAKKQLYISSATFRLHNGLMLKSLPTEFIDEIPDDLLETYDEKKSRAVKKITDTQDCKIYKPLYRPTAYTNIIAQPKNFELNYGVGDKVKHFKFGLCTVKDIKSANADYQITVELADGSEKILMAKLTKLIPIK